MKSKKNHKELNKISKVKKLMYLLIRRFIILFVGIINILVMACLFITTVFMNHDAPIIYGVIGILNIILGWIMVYISLSRLNNYGKLFVSERIGMWLNIFIILIYILLYYIGFS